MFTWSLICGFMPQPAEKTTALFLVQLLQFSGVKPDTATFFTSVHCDFINLAFLQRAITARTLHCGGSGGLGFFRHLHLFAQFFNGFLVLAVKIFFLKTSSPFVKCVRHIIFLLYSFLEPHCRQYHLRY